MSGPIIVGLLISLLVLFVGVRAMRNVAGIQRERRYAYPLMIPGLPFNTLLSDDELMPDVVERIMSELRDWTPDKPLLLDSTLELANLPPAHVNCRCSMVGVVR